MFKKIAFAAALSLIPTFAHASSGANQTIEQIYYCGEDFALKMSGGDWYLVQKSVVGEKKFDHFLSLSMYMMSTGKKTANIFPEEAVETWCGNSGFKPIKILSVQN